jgi:uncharacterized RDD family membrane protein YckC
MAEQSSIVYAGATRRFCALFIDGLVFMLVAIILKMVIGDLRTQQALSQLFVAIYFILLESSGRMASLGKRVMKVYVETDQGSRMPIATAALRYLILVLPTLPTMYFSYTPEFIAMAETEMKYTESNDIPGLIAYLATPEAREINQKFGMLLGVVALLMTFLFWLPVAFTRQKTGLHDYLTKTRVFKRNPDAA